MVIYYKYYIESQGHLCTEMNAEYTETYECITRYAAKTVRPEWQVWIVADCVRTLDNYVRYGADNHECHAAYCCLIEQVNAPYYTCDCLNEQVNAPNYHV